MNFCLPQYTEYWSCSLFCVKPLCILSDKDLQVLPSTSNPLPPLLYEILRKLHLLLLLSTASLLRAIWFLRRLVSTSLLSNIIFSESSWHATCLTQLYFIRAILALTSSFRVILLISPFSTWSPTLIPNIIRLMPICVNLSLFAEQVLYFAKSIPCNTLSRLNSLFFVDFAWEAKRDNILKHTFIADHSYR